MRIDMGARSGIIDDLFTGKFLGLQADIASGVWWKCKWRAVVS